MTDPSIYLLIKNMLGILLAWIIGTTAMQPLDYNFDYSPVEESTTEKIEQPLYEWRASWYDYSLSINWVKKVWTKDHSVCALRIYERYKHYRVCAGDKCIVCKQTDYGPARQDRVIDLSSYAFKQLAPLTRWVVRVKIYLEE